jgi:hypothetical protein
MNYKIVFGNCIVILLFLLVESQGHSVSLDEESEDGSSSIFAERLQIELLKTRNKGEKIFPLEERKKETGDRGRVKRWGGSSEY